MAFDKENRDPSGAELLTQRSSLPPSGVSTGPRVASSNVPLPTSRATEKYPVKAARPAAFSPLCAMPTLSSGSSCSKNALTPGTLRRNTDVSSMEGSTAWSKLGTRRGSTGTSTGQDPILMELTAISRVFGAELEANGAGAELLQRRKDAMSKVLSDLGSPCAWRRFLENEDNLRQLALQMAGTTDATEGMRNDAAASNAAWERALHRLNGLAAQSLVSSSMHRKSSDYVFLWLRLARGHQGEEEKRQVFKYMKSHRIGERVASRFLEQAHLELASGDAERALSVVEQGIRSKAEPAAQLREELQRLQELMRNGGIKGKPMLPLVPLSQLLGFQGNPDEDEASLAEGKEEVEKGDVAAAAVTTSAAAASAATEAPAATAKAAATATAAERQEPPAPAATPSGLTGAAPMAMLVDVAADNGVTNVTTSTAEDSGGGLAAVAARSSRRRAMPEVQRDASEPEQGAPQMKKAKKSNTGQQNGTASGQAQAEALTEGEDAGAVAPAHATTPPKGSKVAQAKKTRAAKPKQKPEAVPGECVPSSEEHHEAKKKRTRAKEVSGGEEVKEGAKKRVNKIKASKSKAEAHKAEAGDRLAEGDGAAVASSGSKGTDHRPSAEREVQTGAAPASGNANPAEQNSTAGTVTSQLMQELMDVTMQGVTEARGSGQEAAKYASTPQAGVQPQEAPQSGSQGVRSQPGRREARQQPKAHEGQQQQGGTPSLKEHSGLGKADGSSHPSVAASVGSLDASLAPSADTSAPAAAPGSAHAAGPSAAPAAQGARETEDYVYVNGAVYQKLALVGRGGSSKVFKVISQQREIFALKRIRLSRTDRDTAKGFIDEIMLLQRLQGKSNIITLVDSEVNEQEKVIYMVLEYGEIDLASLLKKMQQQQQKKAVPATDEGSEGARKPAPARTAGAIGENFLRLYWQNMLEAVHTIHGERIVHSDLKPANFMLVQGQLKLIDFGIARAIQNDTTNIMRDTQVGTLNYMSPEALVGNNNCPGAGEGSAQKSEDGRTGDSASSASILDTSGGKIKVGRASDIWSLGCILYQMVCGDTPFAHLNVIAKLQAITDPSYKIDFPPVDNPDLLDIMKRCLDRNPNTRITIPQLLEHPFLCPRARKRRESEAAQGQAAGPAGGVPPEGALQAGGVGSVAVPAGMDQSLLLEMLSLVSAMAGEGKIVDVAKASAEVFRQLGEGKTKDTLDMKAIVESAVTGNRAPAAAPKPPAPPAPPAPPPPPKRAVPPPPPPPKGGPKKAAPLVIKKSTTPGSKASKPMIGAGDIAAAAAAAARRRAEGGGKPRMRGGSRGRDDEKEGARMPSLRSSQDRDKPGLGGMSANELELAIKKQQARLRPVKKSDVGKGKGKEGGDGDKGAAPPPWESLLKKGLQRVKRSRGEDTLGDDSTIGDHTETWD